MRKRPAGQGQAFLWSLRLVLHTPSLPFLSHLSTHQLCWAHLLSTIRPPCRFWPAVTQAPVCLYQKLKVRLLRPKASCKTWEGSGRAAWLFSAVYARSGVRISNPASPTESPLPYKAFCSVFRPQSSILDALKNLGTLPPAGFMKTTSPPTSHSTTHHGRAQWVPNTYCFRGPSPPPWFSWPM